MKQINNDLIKMFNDLYVLEQETRDLYNDYLRDLKDTKEIKVLTEIRDDEIRHMKLAKEIIDLLNGA